MTMLQRLKSWFRRVDIWSHQRHLMQISDQRLPAGPTLTSEAILYVALTAEELGEVCTAMARAMDAEQRRLHPNSDHPWTLHDPKLFALRNYLDQLGDRWGQNAISVRKLLAQIKVPDIVLPMHDAMEIADGIGDATVTIAGAALAAGLPAGRVYEAIQVSNASKANPKTGKIDKTPDGKWIKSDRYEAPDIAGVLRSAP